MGPHIQKPTTTQRNQHAEAQPPARWFRNSGRPLPRSRRLGQRNVGRSRDKIAAVQRIAVPPFSTQGEIADIDESDRRGHVPLQFEQSDAVHRIKRLRHGAARRQYWEIEQQRWRPVTGGADHGMKLSAGTSKLTVLNPTANTDYTILSGNVTVNVVATRRVVTITLPPEGASTGETVVVTRAAGSTYDVHVVPGSTLTTPDTIDGSSTEIGK